MQFAVHDTNPFPSSNWLPLTFPKTTPLIPEPGRPLAHNESAAFRGEGRFYTPKDLGEIERRIRNGIETCSYEDINMAGEKAWREQPAAFSIKVQESTLNHVGIVYGGHIFNWHLRAAVATARASMCHLFSTPIIRVERGDVDFLAPTLMGNEVRAYATPFHGNSVEPVAENSYRVTYQVKLVAKRIPSALEAPVQYLQVGSSTMQLLLTCPLKDPLFNQSPPKGLPVALLMGNVLPFMRTSPWSATDHSEAVLCRYAQLAAIADYRLWDQAHEDVQRSVSPVALKTRKLSLEFLDASTQNFSREDPPTYIPHSVRKMPLPQNRTALVAHASIGTRDSGQIMRGSAMMVGLT